MKLTIYFLNCLIAGLLVIISCTKTEQTDDPQPGNDGDGLVFETLTIDYVATAASSNLVSIDGTPKIKKGSDGLRIFKFKNEANVPVVIKSAKGSCGCVVPTYPKEPVLPGESRQIEVRYDTNRVGVFTKTVTIITNEVHDTYVLTIKGDVAE